MNSSRSSSIAKYMVFGSALILFGFSPIVRAEYQAFLLENNGGDLRIAAIGDITGDGVSDFATSDAYVTSTATEQGRVTLYSGATRQAIQTLYGAGNYRRLGSALSAIGDVNADGKPDLLVGAAGKGGSAQSNNCTSGAVKGQIIALSGQTPYSTLFTVVSTENKPLGWGDTNNGFGMHLLRLGAAGSTASKFLAPGLPIWTARDISGNVNYCQSSFVGSWVFSSGLSPSQETILSGEGYTNTFLGDFFGSGQQIYAVGGPYNSTISFYRVDTHALVTTKILPTGRSPRAMALISDYNGDGSKDLMVTHATSTTGSAPIVEIYRGGATNSLASLHAITSNNPFFGNSLLEIPDVDSDGRPDFALLNGGDFGVKNSITFYSSANFDPDDFLLKYFSVSNLAVGWHDSGAFAALRLLGDLDGDSKEDFAFSTNFAIYLFLSNTTGGLRPSEWGGDAYYRIANTTVSF